MATITFDKVTKFYENGHEAVSALDLAVGDGEFLVLVGPSGCGKSTALRMVAGLEQISSGRLLIEGRVANDASPRERNIAMVFQSYALYPHLSVADNIGFGLKVRGVGRTETERKVREVARVLELSEYLDRRPAQLSGGQRQRVAMGRALVRSPNAFLMDEPLSNLDARLRGQMRAEIAALQKRIGTTTIYVTHDQVEAMTMGHRVAVMSRGVLQQLATPRELYDAPANLFVAGFIGSPAMNLLSGTLVPEGGSAALRLGDHTIPFTAGELAARPALDRALGTAIVAGIRPEAFRLAADQDSGGLLSGTVRFVEDLGATLLAYVDVEGARVINAGDEQADEFAAAHVRLRVLLDGTLHVRAGQRIRLTVDPARTHVFDAATTLALR